MGKGDLLFIGRVDRLSTSGNAIVREEEMECLGSGMKPNGEVNLGELPKPAVGQAVVFAHNGGTYGICLTKRWVTDDYLTEMQGKTEIDIDDIQVPVGPNSQDIVGDLEDAELVTASSVLHNESIVYKGEEVENVAVVQSMAGDEAGRFLLAVMNGPFVPMGGTPVTVTDMQGDFLTVESCFTAHEDAHPSVDDKIMVRIIEQLPKGSIGVTEVGIPVFIPTGQYQEGNELKVTVTEKTESHFVGEVVLNVGQNSIRVEHLDGAVVENRGQAQRVIWNGIPIDVTPVKVSDLEPERLVITGKNSVAVEAKWDLLSVVEKEVSTEVGDKITFDIRDATGNSCIGSHNGYPVVCSGVHVFPTECEGEQIRGVIESIEPDKAAVSLLHPTENGQELDVEVLGLHRQDGIAVVDGYLVKIPDVRFISDGDEISVVVTSREGDVTEVSAGERIDTRVGDEITFEITEGGGNSCIGSYQGFPVVCTGLKAFPDECEGIQIKGRVEERKSDRLTVSLSHPPETSQELDVEVLSRYEGDIIAVADEYLVTIPAAEIVTHGDVLRAAVTDRGDPITEVSVAARNIFQKSKHSLLVRLPETTGEYKIIDGRLPVVTNHLPDISRPLTLGVADVNTDSVIPEVTALPESHVPELSDHIATRIIRTDEMFAIGVGEELPVELPLLAPVESDAIEMKVGNVARDRVSGVAIGVGDRDVEHFHQYYVCLQIAELAYRKRDYGKVREMLVNARDQLPSDKQVLDAALTAHKPLIDLVCKADIADIQQSEIEAERERLIMLCEKIEKTDESDEVHAYLQACNLELKAANKFIEAVNEATKDTRTSLQSIARGYDSKDRVMEGVTYVDRAIAVTAKTGFSTFVPSNELRVFVDELRRSYPIPVDELDQIPKPKQDANWLSYFVSGEHTDAFERRLSDTDNDMETWTRPSLPTEFGVWSVNDAEAIGGETEPRDSTETLEYSPSSEGINGQADSNGNSLGEELSSDEESETEGESREESRHSETSDSDATQTAEDVEASAAHDRERHETNTATNGDTETGSESDPITDESSEGVIAGPSSIRDTESEKTGDREWDSRIIEEDGDGVDIDDVDAGELTPTPVPDIEVTEELRELRREAEKDATANPAAENSSSVSTGSRAGYVRSPKIRRYARTRADGVCEFCGSFAPFVKPDGEPYLEVHHVDELGDGGADDPSLVVALCPTCHMEIHYGRQGSEINEALREKLEAGLGNIGAIE